MVVFLIVRPPDMSIGMILAYPIAFPIGFLIFMPIISLFFKLLVTRKLSFITVSHIAIFCHKIPLF